MRERKSKREMRKGLLRKKLNVRERLKEKWEKGN
jgi:hypothetical protein